MAINVLSAITVPIPRDGDGYGTDAATRGYVDSNSGGSGGVAGVSSIGGETGAITLGNALTISSDKVLSVSTGTSSGYIPLIGTTAGTVPVLNNNNKLDDSVLSSNVVLMDSFLNSNTLNLYSPIPKTDNSDIDCSSGIGSGATGKNGWAIFIGSTASPSQIICDFKTPDVSPRAYTVEFIVSCAGSPGNSFDIKFVDGDDVDLPFLGDKLVSMERGYTYFIVARRYRTYNSANTMVWSWIFNVQGRVLNPSAS